MLNKKQFYINGDWVDPVNPNDLDVINPSTEEVCAVISLGSKEDTNKAVKAAKSAFTTWKDTSKKERIDLLEKLLEIYKKRSGETPVLVARQLGRIDESLYVTSIDKLIPDNIDMLSILIVGNSTTYSRENYLVTPRGYTISR